MNDTDGGEIERGYWRRPSPSRAPYVVMVICGAFGVGWNLASRGTNWRFLAACAAVMLTSGVVGLAWVGSQQRGK